MVVDASVVLEALISGNPTGDEARARLEADDELVAPHLLDVEVASGLRRLEANRVLPKDLAATAISQLARLPIERYPHQPFLARIWELRGGVSAYDAVYVALAEATKMPLCTSDERLAKAPIRCEVVLVS